MPEFLNGWTVFAATYFLAAWVSFLPTLKAIRKKFNLEEARFSFKDSLNFSEDQRIRLEHHYSRLQGTLVFWKNNAKKYELLHYYCIFWTIIGGIATPVLIQAIDNDAPIYGKWCVTLVALHIAIITAVHKGFKVEQNYKNYRLGESDYYDLRRRLLDQPELLADDEGEQVKQYFSETELIRRDMRNKEIDSMASFDDVKATVQGLTGQLSDIDRRRRRPEGDSRPGGGARPPK